MINRTAGQLSTVIRCDRNSGVLRLWWWHSAFVIMVRACRCGSRMCVNCEGTWQLPVFYTTTRDMSSRDWLMMLRCGCVVSTWWAVAPTTPNELAYGLWPIWGPQGTAANSTYRQMGFPNVWCTRMDWRREKKNLDSRIIYGAPRMSDAWKAPTKK